MKTSSQKFMMLAQYILTPEDSRDTMSCNAALVALPAYAGRLKIGCWIALALLLALLLAQC